MVNSRKYGWEIKGQPLYVEPHDGHQNIGDDPILEKEIKEKSEKWGWIVVIHY